MKTGHDVVVAVVVAVAVDMIIVFTPVDEAADVVATTPTVDVAADAVHVVAATTLFTPVYDANIMVVRAATAVDVDAAAFVVAGHGARKGSGRRV